MTRHIVLGNGSLLVNIDRWLQVRDLFFPRVGQYNHLFGHAHKIGLIEAYTVTWLNDASWRRNLTYLDGTLITNSTADNEAMKLSLLFNENVYCEDNIFFRMITVRNNAGKKRKIRIFFHHDFHMYGDGVGDTALFHPKHEAILHYKRSAYFLIGVCSLDQKSILSDFNIGEHITPGLNLQKNPIAQGNVDSIICADIVVEPQSEYSFCYYLAAGENFGEVFKLAYSFLNKGIEAHLEHAQKCQRDWLARIKPDISILDQKLQDFYKRSLLIIKTQIDKGGAITAANDSDNMQFNKDTYSYMWPRDGALVAIALIKAGYPEMAIPFFEFCRDVLTEEGYLLHKYNPDKTLGSSWHPWILNGDFSLPIQEDETALVLHALWKYFEYTKDEKFIKKMYPSLIRPIGQFLAKYRHENSLPKESYDLWEERRAIFAFTTATVIAGLTAADKFGRMMSDAEFCETCNLWQSSMKGALIAHFYNDEKGYFRRAVSFEGGEIRNDDAIDSSVYGLFEFGVFSADDEKIASTMQRMKDWLTVKTDVGGFARYYNDHYHQKSIDLSNVPGNPWFICTLWYAKYIIQKAKKRKDLDEALELINWTMNHSLSTGIMPEQVHPLTGEPISVSPLTWSHAEFVDTVTNYIQKYKELG